MAAVEMVELWRGPVRESVHRGHAVVCAASGEVVQVWGDADKTVLPRSSIKMIQALPLIESGAADAFCLGTEQLALSCASHSGGAIHTERVARWLDGIGMGEADLRCGAQVPSDPQARKAVTCSDDGPCQLHNNCSGKHAGFLTLAKHLGAGPEYIDPDHPVQKEVHGVWEDITQETCPGFGIDGCSAPNFAASLTGVARAVASFAGASEGRSTRETAQVNLVSAMTKHPELVAGEGRACTMLMRELGGQVAVKTGAEGFFTAILPQQNLGIALKIDDGTTRAAESAICAILVRLGVLGSDSEAARRFHAPRLRSRRGLDIGVMRPVPGVFD